jgi:hypothetical protein
MSMLGDRRFGYWLLPILLCLMLVGMLLLGQPWLPQGSPWLPQGIKRSEERGLDKEEIAASTTSHSTASHGEWLPSARPSGQTVALTIDFGNGAKREFSALPWRNGMTVADLMEAAHHFRPPITYTQKGIGAQAFLTSLEGVAHQTSQGNFWFYEINGKRGIRSFGIQPLLSSDRVLWIFGPQE